MRLYCGNLPPGILPEELRGLLESFGRVDAVSIVGADEPARERRFAFVVMPVADEAERAIAALNGKVFQGFELTINEARPRKAAESVRFGKRRRELPE